MIRLITKGAQLAYGVKYSRFYLQDLARDRVAEQRALEQLQEQQRLEDIRNLPANDSNPSNRISVRINSSIFGINPKEEYLRQSCWVLEPKPIEIMPKKIISATRKYIITSLKKARTAMTPIKKKHILDALNTLQSSQKKVAKLMVRTIYNVMDHAKHRGFNPLRLWVHGCIIGKTKRYRGVRYHAKGRGCREKKDFCQVKIIFYQKPQKQFFQEIGTGKCSPGVANVLRFALKERFDYDTLSKFTGVATSRGRQQARQIFKRKIDKLMSENEKQGTYEPRKVIESRLRQSQGVRARQKFKLLQQQEFTSVKVRQRQFKKNMGT